MYVQYVSVLVSFNVIKKRIMFVRVQTYSKQIEKMASLFSYLNVLSLPGSVDPGQLSVNGLSYF